MLPLAGLSLLSNVAPVTAGELDKLLQRARQQFIAAGEFETTEQQARQWIKYLDYVQPEHPDVAGL